MVPLVMDPESASFLNPTLVSSGFQDAKKNKKILLFAYYDTFGRYNYEGFCKVCKTIFFWFFSQQVEGSESIRIITDPEDQKITDSDHW